MRAADGKMRLTDALDTEQLFRFIQSIPSPKAEPFKLWLAQIAKERLDELQDPELTIDRAMFQYKQLGYSDSWINQRLKSIEIRKDLTDEWKRHDLEEGVHFATLTDIIYKTWADNTNCTYKMTQSHFYVYCCICRLKIPLAEGIQTNRTMRRSRNWAILFVQSV